VQLGTEVSLTGSTLCVLQQFRHARGTYAHAALHLTHQGVGALLHNQLHVPHTASLKVCYYVAVTPARQQLL
jgi:hypothetical protein